MSFDPKLKIVFFELGFGRNLFLPRISNETVGVDIDKPAMILLKSKGDCRNCVYADLNPIKIRFFFFFKEEKIIIGKSVSEGGF